MDTQNPKGILIPIGGSEDDTVLCRVLDETRKKDPLIEVITIAAGLPEETGKSYLQAFDDLDVGDVGEIYIKDRSEVADFVNRIKKCDGVFFSGGNQLRLTTL